jgi:hypothetical protein
MTLSDAKARASDLIHISIMLLVAAGVLYERALVVRAACNGV